MKKNIKIDQFNLRYHFFKSSGLNCQKQKQKTI